jgi:preprotein translocase subunit SecG
MPTAILAVDRSTLVKVLVTGMFFVMAVDMGGEFGLRNAVVPVCALALLLLAGPVLPGNWLPPFLLLVAYPTAMLVLGLSSGAEKAVALSQYQSTVLAFVLYVLVFHLPHRVTENALLYSLFAVSLVALALAVALFLGVPGVADLLAQMADRRGGYFGERGVGIEDVLPNVYFKATLFFVPTFVLALFTGKRLIALACFLGLVVAISKTGMVVTALVALAFLARKGSWRGFAVGGLLLAGVAALLAQTPLFILFSEIAQNDSVTVNVRAGHLESLLRLWRDRPAGLLFGFGLGSAFHSAGAGETVSNIEIDHFNVVRKYGLLWALAFFAWVMRVAYTAIRDARTDVRGLGWGLVVAFLVAGTNPVLISPMFFLFLFVTMAAIDQAEAGPARGPT